jgi:long-chain acyl-CoA synthetase
VSRYAIGVNLFHLDAKRTPSQNIVKLAQGEYVAVEKIENLYSSNPLIAQLYVHADSLQSYLVAVIVPDPVQLAAIASKVQRQHISPVDAPTLVKAAADPKVVAAIHKELNKEAFKHKLKGSVPVLCFWDT